MANLAVQPRAAESATPPGPTPNAPGSPPNAKTEANNPNNQATHPPPSAALPKVGPATAAEEVSSPPHPTVEKLIAPPPTPPEATNPSQTVEAPPTTIPNQKESPPALEGAANSASTASPSQPVDAPQTETGSQRPGSVSADDLRARQEQFENETLEKARRNTEGAINSVKSGEEELRRLDGKWFVGEARETVRKQLEYDRNTIEARQAHEETLSKNLTESRKLSDDAARLSREAQELHAVGNLELAQKKEAEASKLRGLASARLEGQSYYDRAIEEESRRNLQETNKALGKAIDHLDTAITVVEYADQGVKIAGVAAGTVIAGPAGAAAVSALYDEVKAVGTAGTEYAMGDKTLREAAQDVAGKQTDIIVDAGLAAGTAYVGGKTGEAIGKMGGNVLTKVAAGAASGSATNVAGEGIKIGAERIQAEIAFNQANPNLAGAERDAALKVFLKDRGLDGEHITHRVTAAAVSGAVTGGVSAGTANLGKVTQIAANDIAGGGTQAAQEYASTGQLTVGGVLVATAAGHLGNRMGSASRPSSLGRTPVGGTHIEPAEHIAPKQTSPTSAPHGSKQSAPLPSESDATTVAATQASPLQKPENQHTPPVSGQAHFEPAKPLQVKSGPTATTSIISNAHEGVEKFSTSRKDPHAPLTVSEFYDMAADPKVNGWFKALEPADKNELNKALQGGKVTPNNLQERIGGSSEKLNPEGVFLANAGYDGNRQALKGSEITTPDGTTYRVVDVLGSGAAGVVLKARPIDPATGVPGEAVALKFEIAPMKGSVENQIEGGRRANGAREYGTPEPTKGGYVVTNGVPVGYTVMKVAKGETFGAYVHRTAKAGSGQELLQVTAKTVAAWKESRDDMAIPTDPHSNNIMTRVGEDGVKVTIIDQASLPRSAAEAHACGEDALRCTSDAMKASVRLYRDAHPGAELPPEYRALERVSGMIDRGELNLDTANTVMQELADASKEPRARWREQRIEHVLDRVDTAVGVN